MAQPGFFEQTSWTTVINAKADDETLRLAALERLLTHYRRPILLEIQSRAGCSESESEELAHQFIHNCLRRDFLKNVDPEKGRFRSFIKTCIKNFLLDLHREKARQPGQVSLDETDEEGRRIMEPAGETPSAETSADSHRAQEVLALSLERLEQECTDARRGALFPALKSFLDGDSHGEGYAPIAARLRMTEGALRTATRMRQHLGELIEEEIKQTVSNRDDWRDELRYFLELLGRNCSVT